MVEAEIIGKRVKSTEKVNCLECGKLLIYNGYLSYDLKGNLREKYLRCLECKEKLGITDK